MNNFSRKLPLGIQDFEDLRLNGYVYVDKTDLIYKLVNNGKPYFLSRPRRFGKSLLISTIEAYFLGKKNLFKGLMIEGLEKDNPHAWEAHPVLKFSLAGGEYKTENGLRDALLDCLKHFEQDYSLTVDTNDSLSIRFKNDLINAKKQTGKNVVVLIDEYDNPLLKMMGQETLQMENNRDLYKGFFATLKDCDAYLRFVLFTGVTKFRKVSIFSDLNQLSDITLDNRYATICGITQSELEENFKPEIASMAEAWNFSYEECLERLKTMYDGYHFSSDGEGMYNPFSLIHAFDQKDFGAYWFGSGTPTFLINKLKEINFDARNFIDNVKVLESQIADYRPENPDPIPLFYQSGYLTIKKWNPKQRAYKLGFPNEEVKYGFLNALAPSYLKIDDKVSNLNIETLDDAAEEGDTEAMKNWFISLFAILPYPTGKDILSVTEQNFQNVIFITFTMMGKYARTEVHSSSGRADCILETDDYVYVFEFKKDQSAEAALEQIEANNYAAQYTNDTRKLFKIGVNFSSETKNIEKWLVR